jgi:hypothetical protein
MSLPSDKKRSRLVAFVFPATALLLIAGREVPRMVFRPTYRTVDLKAMGYFNLDQRDGSLGDVPARYRSLDGTKVRLKGFTFGGDNYAGKAISLFQIVYNIQYDHGPPLVQERVFARAVPGIANHDVSEFVDVFGTLHVNVKHDRTDGTITSVYELDVDGVSPEGGDFRPRWMQMTDPLPTIGALALLVWGIWMIRNLIVRFGSIVPGVCLNCGYDLRASRERCPECGTPNPDWIQPPRRLDRDPPIRG